MPSAEVLGIISAVISIVDATSKVYNATKDKTGLPPNFKTVATKLPLLSRLLEDAERHVDEKADDALTSTFTPVLTDCQEKAAQLQQLFEKVIPTDADSRSERYFKAAWTLGRVETLMKGILDSVQLLTAEFPKALSQRRQESLTKAIEELSELEAEQDCRYDLFVTDPLEDKKALERKKGDRVAGTCEWVLGTEDLIAWLGPSQAQRSASRANQVLWLHGNPGTGKSTLAMYLTDALSTRFSATDGHTLAYFFCDSAFDTRRSATSVMRGLLFQLIQQYPQLLSYVLPKYKERKAKLFESFDALWAIFISAAADRYTGRKYCIIDALDELDDESQTTLLRQLQETFHGADDPPDARFLFTSRLHPEIYNHLAVFPHKNLASFADVKHDVDKCIKERVAQLKYPEKVKGQAIEILQGKAKGIFLWVGIACNELENTPSKDAISRLAEMPIGLYSLYERLFSAALEKGRNKSMIRLVLNFVVASQRPLTLWELCEACQLRPEEDDIETRIQFMREYVESCRLMVVFQDEKVLLLHQSVKDYLTRSGELRLEDSATNLDDQSDLSDISYISSVYTQATDSTSHTLFSTEDQDPLQMASETLACHVYMDSGVHDLYLHAFQEFGSTRFSRNHDKLLKIFLKDLCRTTTEPKLELAVRLLGRRQSRSLVTASILRMLYHELNDSGESRKFMQQFLDQQEDRNYSLNRLLRSQQNASFVADTDNNKTLANELEASDDDDDETDEEEEGHNSEAGAFNHVERLINHITTGTPYQTFASNLECLTHPPTTLDAALALRNIRALRRLLRKQFNNVAQGRYAWLHDLEELGHTRDEIADILLEEVSDSPWIYFTPPPKLEPMISVQAETHLPGCVHRLAWNSFDTTGDAQTCTFVPALRESSTLLEVERLCGLAGITPSSRNVEEWNGSVAFEEDNTIAMITYAHSDVSKIIHRLEATLGLFCAAIRYCQSQQLCCDSFTVLKQPASILYEKSRGGRSSVEVYRVDFCIAFQLLNEVRALAAT